MSNGIDRRAQIDNETVKALLLLNGGGAVALLAFLPAIIDKKPYRLLTLGILIGLLVFMAGPVFAVIHNHLRRHCSLEYERHSMKPPHGQILGIQLRRPRVCWLSIAFMYLSLFAFIGAGTAIAISGLYVISRLD